MQDMRNAMLREVAEQEGWATRASLTELFNGETISLIAHLRNEGLIASQPRSNGPKTYAITSKGQKVIHDMDKPMGLMPAPRTGPSSACYLGERPTFIRDGAMRAYELPSMTASGPVDRARPIIMGSSVPGIPLGR